MRPAGEVTGAGPENQSPGGCGPGMLRLGIVKGDNLRRSFTMLDSAGAALPMGGVVAHSTIRNAGGEPVAEWGSVAPDPRIFLADGLVEIGVPGSETDADGFQPGAAYWWDLVLVTPQGQRYTVLVGPVSVFNPPSASWQP